MRYAERSHKTWLVADDAARASQRVNEHVMGIIGILALFVIIYGLMGGFAW